MELVSSGINVNFMKARFAAFCVSLLLLLYSGYVWLQAGDAKYGVDFLGGTDLVVEFEENVKIGQVRSVLSDAGITGAVVQAFEGSGNDFSIRLKSNRGADTGKKLRTILEESELSDFEVLKEDFVGPIIGEQIREDGITSLVIALICILLYISFRFEWRFAVGAIVALMHDVAITTGLFVASGNEISAGVLAALLTIIGYSLNDTIIVFDRVRENFNLVQKGKKKGKELQELSFVELVNGSVNQTVSRTLLTSLTTLLVVACLWLLGGGAVADLAFALVIGVIVGTYSSVYVACPAVIALEPKDAAQGKQLKKAA